MQYLYHQNKDSRTLRGALSCTCMKILQLLAIHGKCSLPNPKASINNERTFKNEKFNLSSNINIEKFNK